MSRLPHDIDDDEIRIISSDNDNDSGSLGGNEPKNILHGKWKKAVLIAAAVVLAALAICFLLRPGHDTPAGEELVLVSTDAPSESGAATDSIASADNNAVASAAPAEKSHVEFTDTVVNGVPLAIFRPVNATPRLEVGTDALNDSNAILILQAADIRRDNGKIVGAYVLCGELLSKGQAKSGYCAIIGGSLTIGVAEATPLLEQAIENDGYFFRQYPLVVANQIVENKPKGSSLRRALAELDGHIAVILSRRNMTFHDFSQALVDLGVSNAIYLVGSGAHGFAVDSDGRRIQFGSFIPTSQENANYILWE